MWCKLFLIFSLVLSIKILDDKINCEVIKTNLLRHNFTVLFVMDLIEYEKIIFYFLKKILFLVSLSFSRNYCNYSNYK